MMGGQTMNLKDRLLRSLFVKVYRDKLAEMVKPFYPVLLDYPFVLRTRYGYSDPPHPQLLDLLQCGRTKYAERLVNLCSVAKCLNRIPVESSGSQEPYWNQAWFTTLDAAALYGMLCEFRPKRIIEVGSGHSTRFARRAIRDHSIGTHLMSIDPEPRSEIDEICDLVVRSRLEDVDLRVFDELEAGDFLFIDSSHRSFPNSDVTVLFLEILPRLRPGVIVHVHDIFWPNDYLPETLGRYYSEQYLLGAYLLGDAGSRIEILMPVAFVSQDAELSAICTPFLEVLGIGWSKNPVVWPYSMAGASFWFRRS